MEEKTSQTSHTIKNNPLDTVIEAGQKDPFFLIREMYGLTVQPPRPHAREKVEKLFTCPHKEFEEIANSLSLEDFERFENGTHLTWHQFILILAYARAMAGTLPRRIAVRSGRGVSKSATLAMIIYHFLFVYANSLVAATAPTGEQIYGALWKEAALWLTKMKKPFKDVFEWQSYFIRHRETPNVWYARAKTAENIEALSGLHCFEERTVEVLTKDGFKDFKDISKNDFVWTRQGWENPEKIIRSEYEGDMVRQDSKFFNFSVTPEHKFPASLRNTNYLRDNVEEWSKEKLIPVSDWKSKIVKVPRRIKNFKGENKKTYTIPEYKKRHWSEKDRKPIAIKMDDWVAFIGWYLSEGYIKTDSQTKNKTIVCISQTMVNKKNRNEIYSLAKRMGFNPSETSPKDITIGNVQLANHISSLCPGKALTKVIPDFIFDLSPRQMRIFLDAYMKGDGYTDSNTGRIGYVTGSKKMADDLQKLILLSGGYATIQIMHIKGTSVTVGERKGIRNSNVYVVREWSDNRNYHAVSKGKNRRIEKYKGIIECLTVPSHMFYVRDKKTSQSFWTGNSDWQMSIIDEASAVATEVMEVGWDTMTTPNKVMITTSNPTRTDGWFYDLFTNDDQEWVKLVFNAEESPVVDQKKLEVDRELRGRDNEKYRVSVLGEFPLKQTEQDGWYRFFSDKWIDDVVREEDDVNNPYDYDRSRLALGTDVAGSGGDETVGALRSPRWAKILFKQALSTSDTVSGAIELALSNFKQLSARDVFYDAFGVGHNIGQKVLQNDPNGRNVTTPLSVGELPEEKEYKERYVNKRAMFYDALRLWGERGGRIQGDAGMKEELKTILAKRTGRDRLQIMSKAEMKKKGNKSPDQIDSIMLSFGNDYYRVIEGLPLVKVERKLKPWEKSQEENFNPNDFVPGF